MSQIEKVHLPDIGDFSDVEIIEMHVSVGAVLEIEDPILTLESDKATMEVPSPTAGKITEIAVAVGDKISEGDFLVSVETSSSSVEDSVENEQENNQSTSSTEKQTDSQSSGSCSQEVRLPDIGDFSDVEIIEMHVDVGDVLASEDPILTLESDKATMEVPSPVAGKVTAVGVKIGDKVSQDDYLLTVETSASDSTIVLKIHQLNKLKQRIQTNPRLNKRIPNLLSQRRI